MPLETRREKFDDTLNLLQRLLNEEEDSAYGKYYKFEPLTIDKWQKSFYASPIDFGGGIPGSQPNNAASPTSMPHVD